MKYLGKRNIGTGIDGSVKDGVGGYSFCLSDNNLTRNILGYAQTVGHTRDRPSLRAEQMGIAGHTISLCYVYILSTYFVPYRA